MSFILFAISEKFQLHACRMVPVLTASGLTVILSLANADVAKPRIDKSVIVDFEYINNKNLKLSLKFYAVLHMANLIKIWSLCKFVHINLKSVLNTNIV